MLLTGAISVHCYVICHSWAHMMTQDNPAGEGGGGVSVLSLLPFPPRCVDFNTNC